MRQLIRAFQRPIMHCLATEIEQEKISNTDWNDMGWETWTLDLSLTPCLVPLYLLQPILIYSRFFHLMAENIKSPLKGS